MVSVRDKVIYLQSDDEDDKPRDIYRIRRSDYMKLPPIKPTIINDCCPRSEEPVVSDYVIDLERYVKDLLPDINSHPTKLRKTNKSPLPQTDLSLFPHSAKHLKKTKLMSYTLPRGYVSKTKTGEIPDFNRDMLIKEVEIKRILESHRSTLLRSLQDLRTGRPIFLDLDELEVEGIGGAMEDSVPLKSMSTRSTISDSAFGEWEGTREGTDDYLPSGRTLVTDDPDWFTALHTLEEKILAADESGHEDSDKSIEDDEELMIHEPSPSPEMSKIPSVKFVPKILSETPTASIPPLPKQPAPKLETPKLPTPKLETPKLPTPKLDTHKLDTPKLETPKPPALTSPTPRSPSTKTEHPEPTPSPERAIEEEQEENMSPLFGDLDDLLSVDDDITAETESDIETPAMIQESENEDILGINAMLMDTEDEIEVDQDTEPIIEKSPITENSYNSETPQSDPGSVTPPQFYEYKPPVKEPTPTPPPPTPPAPALPATPPPILPRVKEVKKKFPPPPKRRGLSFIEEDALKEKMELIAMERARAQQKSRVKMIAEAAEPESDHELQGDEDVGQILDRFTIVDKGRLNYLHKIFGSYLPSEDDIYLTHTEMKKALSQIKSCTKITRNQLKFIEIILGLRKNKISFHTFAVMATLLDHMSHKDPTTLAMFDSIDLTRMEHDLPRLKRLFHCVSEKDDFGWPRLTTSAMDIELRAACVSEKTRNNLIKQLDPDNDGEISIFDFIIYTPLWIYLHDGIVENPFNDTERDVTSPVHRKWGVSVLWMPEVSQNARDPPATPASGCGSELSTPDLFVEPHNMRAVQGTEYSESEDADESVVNSDED